MITIELLQPGINLFSYYKNAVNFFFFFFAGALLCTGIHIYFWWEGGLNGYIF